MPGTGGRLSLESVVGYVWNLQSRAIFSKEDVRKQYSESEQKYITSRILRAALLSDIRPTPETWAFSDISIPVESLTNEELQKIINQKLKFSNKNFATNNKGTTMEEWFNGFLTAMTQKMSQTVNQEVGTQFQSWADEYKTATPLPGASAQDKIGTQASEQPEIPNEYKERISSLEKENREMKFNSYFDGQVSIGQLTPAQKSVVMANLEAAYSSAKSYEFSENGKTVKAQGEELIKLLIASYPKQIEFSEIASKEKAALASDAKSSNFSAPEGMDTDEERMMLNDKVVKLIEEQLKIGKKMTYVEALQQVVKK